MCNLVYIAHLLECQCPTLVVSMKIYFISLFFVLGWVFACVRLLLFMYVTLWILHVSHTFQGSAKQNLFPFITCSQGFWLKDLWSKPFLPFTKGFLNGHLWWNLWRMASNNQQLRDSNHFTSLTNEPKIIGYRDVLFFVSTFISGIWMSRLAEGYETQHCSIPQIWPLDLDSPLITIQPMVKKLK